LECKHSRHRCEIEIAACLLSSVADKPMRKTWMMNAANLNHILMEKQLRRLLGCGFIAQVNGDVYELTEDGRAFLGEYNRFKRLEEVLLRAKRIEEEVEEPAGPD
jgi:predicted transcriptional regulator